MRRFYTYFTAAQLLGVSERTVFTWVRRGQLNAMRVGRTVRISEAAIREFVAKNQSRAGSDAAADNCSSQGSN